MVGKVIHRTGAVIDPPGSHILGIEIMRLTFTFPFVHHQSHDWKVGKDGYQILRLALEWRLIREYPLTAED